MHAVILAVLAYFGGCQMMVLGDSNSCARAAGCATSPLKPLWADWPLPPPFVLENASLPGMTAGDYSVCSNKPGTACTSDAQCFGDGRCVRATYGDGSPVAGAWHLERLLAAHERRLTLACWLPSWLPRPKLVLALGTNDLWLQPTGYGAAQAILALYDRARAAAPCIDVYVATIPPRTDVEPAKVAQTNAALLLGLSTRGASARIIPFARESPADLDTDHVHMTAQGQQHRWQLAWPVLFPDQR